MPQRNELQRKLERMQPQGLLPRTECEKGRRSRPSHWSTLSPHQLLPPAFGSGGNNQVPWLPECVTYVATDSLLDGAAAVTLGAACDVAFPQKSG
jgi:hypothetical protein